MSNSDKREGLDGESQVQIAISITDTDGITTPENEYARDHARKTESTFELLSRSCSTSPERVQADCGVRQKQRRELSTWQTFVIILALAGITATSCMSTGAFTISLPVIARDLQLSEKFLLWPASMYSLTSGCTLLLAGSIADHVGNRVINILGCFFLGIFILASGLSRTGLQLILFRGFQGVAVSMCLPTAFSIITDTFPTGKRRNIAFACLGLGQPLGWSVGLIVGGLCEGTPLGWRFAFYIPAGLAILLGFVNMWKLPQDRKREPLSRSKFFRSVDWTGLLISSTCLAAFSYVLAAITGSLDAIKLPVNIFLLCIAAALVPTFVWWMHKQEIAGRPALIPNSMWRNRAFSCICIMVILAWAALQCIELFLSLFFQEVQHLHVLAAALRFLPNVVLGIVINILTGLLVHRIRADWLVLAANALCALSPLLLALANPAWDFWTCIFWAVLLSPASADVIFTIANLIITDVFPPHTQALAGAVFNTVAQFGTTIGLAVAAVVAGGVTAAYERGHADVGGYAGESGGGGREEALLEGYRAVFWMCFGAMIVVAAVGAWGLREVGIVGRVAEETGKVEGREGEGEV